MAITKIYWDEWSSIVEVKMVEIKITVNGEEVRLTEFPSQIITNVILGILSSLKGVDEIKNAKIELVEKK